jgi:hypothetical protein
MSRPVALMGATLPMLVPAAPATTTLALHGPSRYASSAGP